MYCTFELQKSFETFPKTYIIIEFLVNGVVNGTFSNAEITIIASIKVLFFDLFLNYKLTKKYYEAYRLCYSRMEN